MTDAQAAEGLDVARVLAPESWMGDAATILDEHTLMLTIHGTTACPVRGVTAAESTSGHLSVRVDRAEGACDGPRSRAPGG